MLSRNVIYGKLGMTVEIRAYNFDFWYQFGAKLGFIIRTGPQN